MQNLSEFAIAIVTLGIVVAVGSTVLIGVRDTNTSGDSAYNLANSAATGIAEYGNWFKVLVIVAIAGVILGLIFMSFGRNTGSA